MDAAVTPRGAQSPRGLDEALALRADPRWLVVAGGTDVYPAHVGRAMLRPVLDLSYVSELRVIGQRVDAAGRSWVRIGAGATWTDLRSAMSVPGLEALAQAAAEVGGLQIQNQGTIGGNLCNASPAADGMPALLALGAEVELASARGRRRLPVGEFVLGSRRTALADDELLVAVEVPLPSSEAVSCFLKLGHRRYLVISIVMVAVQIDLDPGQVIRSCRVAVGSCSAVARRLEIIERRLTGMALDKASTELERLFVAGGEASGWIASVLTPIDDVRGTAAYRLEAARELVRRALDATIAVRRSN